MSDKLRVDSFPVASEAINGLMAVVIEGVRVDKTLRHKLFQAAFHVTLSGEAMVRLWASVCILLALCPLP